MPVAAGDCPERVRVVRDDPVDNFRPRETFDVAPGAGDEAFDRRTTRVENHEPLGNGLNLDGI